MLLDLALSPTSTGCTSSYKACCSTWPLHVVWDPLNFSRLSTFSTFWLIRLINLSNHDFPFLDSTVQDSLALYLSLEPGSYRCLLRIAHQTIFASQSTAMALFTSLPHLVAVTLNILFPFKQAVSPYRHSEVASNVFAKGYVKTCADNTLFCKVLGCSAGREVSLKSIFYIDDQSVVKERISSACLGVRVRQNSFNGQFTISGCTKKSGF